MVAGSRWDRMKVSETGTWQTKWARKAIREKGSLGKRFGNELATALPIRPQRDPNVNKYSIAVNSFRWKPWYTVAVPIVRAADI